VTLATEPRPPVAALPPPRTEATWAWLRWAAAILVSGGILGYLFASHGLDLRMLAELIATIHLPGVAAFLAVSLVALMLRTLRYWVLLERRANLWPLTLVTLVRNLFVDLVPARAGAAASYLYLVTRRLGVPAEVAIASFAVSFILDTLALAPLLLAALVVVGAAPVPPLLLAGASLVLLVGAAIALLLLPAALGVVAAAAGRLPGRARRAALPLSRAAGQVRRLDRRRVLLPALALSLALRLAKYGAYYCLLQALLVGQGHEWGSLNFLRVFLSVAGAELAASLPLPTIASLGPYEAAGAAGFAYWLGLPRDLAALAVTAFHGLSQLHDYSLGLLALLWIMAPWTGRRMGRSAVR
jgi:uncharacterized membrane protein YbhN (UPF0104 family)